jgi:hypothetical protein
MVTCGVGGGNFWVTSLFHYKFYPFFAQSGFWVILLLHQASDSEKLPEVGEPVLNNIDCRAACPVAGLLAMTL